MKNILFLLLAVLFMGNQNPNKDNRQKNQSDHTTPVHEKTFVTLGGEQQYVEMTGRSDQLPVLLFLHGGPGWPQTPHLRYFNAELTKHMIVVSWDQAGCGQSYLKNPHPKKLSNESLIHDAHELTQYLKKKFNKKKIFLLGFSYGSVIGLQLAKRYPADYVAYIGVSQLINSKQSWDASMQWLKKQALKKNDTTVLHQLQLIENRNPSVCKTDLACFMSKYQLLAKYNATIYKKKKAAEIEKAEKFYPDYKNYHWFEAFNYTASRFGGKQFHLDLSGITTLKIPVYLMAGRHDWNIPGIVTEKYFHHVKAPEKQFIWFEKSGHEPPEEEAKKFNRLIIQIVKENTAQSGL